ncbi:MAG: hypothetical protein H7123_03430, partial [Thermoleophilia bacterium]|nr:hypothetical protein [Thermoleophilia bacterium]
MRLTPAAIGWLAVWLFARVLMRPFLPDVPLTVCERCPQLLDAHGTTARVVTVSSANGGLFLGPIDRIGTKALPEGMQQIHRGGKLITDLKAAG